MDDIVMSKQERNKLEVFSRVKEGVLSLRTASGLLGISYQQCRRIFKRYKEEGDKGLMHKARGKKSNAGISAEKKQVILGLYESKYIDFGPSLAAEHLLKDDGCKIKS